MTPTHIAIRLKEALDQAKTLRDAGWSRTPCAECSGSGTTWFSPNNPTPVELCRACEGSRWFWTEPEPQNVEVGCVEKPPEKPPTLQEALKDARCPKCGSARWEAIGGSYDGTVSLLRCEACNWNWDHPVKATEVRCPKCQAQTCDISIYDRIHGEFYACQCSHCGHGWSEPASNVAPDDVNYMCPRCDALGFNITDKSFPDLTEGKEGTHILFECVRCNLAWRWFRKAVK